MDKTKTFEEKHELLTEILLVKRALLPEDNKFYEDNMPEGLAKTTEAEEKVKEVLALTNLTDKQQLAFYGDIINLINDAICMCQDFHYLLGYKQGAKMMTEILSN